MIWAICWGVFFEIYMYHWDAIHIYIMAAVAYIMMCILPRKTVHYWVVGYLLTHVLY